jgi:hypothetical protein
VSTGYRLAEGTPQQQVERTGGHAPPKHRRWWSKPPVGFRTPRWDRRELCVRGVRCTGNRPRAKQDGRIVGAASIVVTESGPSQRMFPPRFAHRRTRRVQPVSTGETLRSRLLPRVGNDETMNYDVKAFYPVSLAAVDIAIGTGFLHVRGPSPIGLLMSLLGVIVVCHALYSTAKQVDSAVHRTASESEETVPSRPDEASVKPFARPVFRDDAACGGPVPSRCRSQREASRRRCRRPHSPRPRPPALECGEYASVSARSGVRRYCRCVRLRSRLGPGSGFRVSHDTTRSAGAARLRTDRGIASW